LTSRQVLFTEFKLFPNSQSVHFHPIGESGVFLAIPIFWKKTQNKGLFRAVIGSTSIDHRAKAEYPAQLNQAATLCWFG